MAAAESFAADGAEAVGYGVCVVLADGSRIDAEVAVAGLGIVPNDGPAARTGIEVNEGVVVRRALQVERRGRLCGGRRRSSRHPPSHPGRSLLGYVAVTHAAIGVAHLKRESRPRAQLASRGEPFDVADLRDEHHRGEISDAVELLEGLHPGIRFGGSSDLVLQPGDGLFGRVQQREQVIDDGALRRRELDAGEPLASGPPRAWES